jgi:hypothetical protein
VPGRGLDWVSSSLLSLQQLESPIDTRARDRDMRLRPCPSVRLAAAAAH